MLKLSFSSDVVKLVIQKYCFIIIVVKIGNKLRETHPNHSLFFQMNKKLLLFNLFIIKLGNQSYFSTSSESRIFEGLYYLPTYFLSVLILYSITKGSEKILKLYYSYI